MQIQYNIQDNTIQYNIQDNTIDPINTTNTTQKNIPDISHARLSDNKRERAAYEGDLVCNALYLFLHNELHCTAYHWIYYHSVLCCSAEASLPIKAKAAIGERHETWEGGLRVLADFNIWFKILWVKVFWSKRPKKCLKNTQTSAQQNY